MTHKTSEEELERLANESCKNTITPSMCAHQSETELLRKRIRELEDGFKQIKFRYGQDTHAGRIALVALADDKASETGVVDGNS